MNQSINSELTLVCIANRRETNDINVITFESNFSEAIKFKPGQYITLKIPIDGQIICRCYTLSSSPGASHNNNQSLELIVKRVPQGKVSNWLLDKLSVGFSIQANPPTGQFHLEVAKRRKLLLLSAGVGITPMLSILRHISEHNLDIDIIFHHSVRSCDDLIAFNELIDYNKLSQKFTLSYNITREAPLTLAPAKAFQGRLCREILNNICTDIEQRDVFTCGPQGFMGQAKLHLLNQGLPLNQYFQESFEVEPIESINIEETKNYQVEFCHSNSKVVINAGQTVLEAAEEAGIYIDTSCSSGICGSCSSYLIEGKVNAPQAQAIELENDTSCEFLPCCSYPVSNLKVDL